MDDGRQPCHRRLYSSCSASKGLHFLFNVCRRFFSFNIKTCFNVFFAKILVLTFVIFVVTAATEEDLSAGWARRGEDCGDSCGALPTQCSAATDTHEGSTHHEHSPTTTTHGRRERLDHTSRPAQPGRTRSTWRTDLKAVVRPIGLVRLDHA